MTRRKYMYEAPRPGRKGRTVLELVQEGGLNEHANAILALPAATLPAVTADILAALRTAYQDGREDRSAELLPLGRPRDRLRSLVHTIALDAIGQRAMDDGRYGGHGEHCIALEARDDASGTLTMAVREDRHDQQPLKRYRVSVLVEEVETS